MEETKKKRSKLMPFVVGGVVGSASAILVWVVLSAILDKQFENGRVELMGKLTTGQSTLQQQLTQARTELGPMVRQQLQQQLPPMVRTEIQNTLSSYGLTPSVAAQIRNMANYLESTGLI